MHSSHTLSYHDPCALPTFSFCLFFTSDRDVRQVVVQRRHPSNRRQPQNDYAWFKDTEASFPTKALLSPGARFFLPKGRLGKALILPHLPPDDTSWLLLHFYRQLSSLTVKTHRLGPSHKDVYSLTSQPRVLVPGSFTALLCAESKMTLLLSS